LLSSEELGVTHANVDDIVHSADPDIRRLLGNKAVFGAGLGLDNNFAVKVIKAVGNYGKIYECSLGEYSRLKIAQPVEQGRLAIRPTRQIGRTKAKRPLDSDRNSSYSNGGPGDVRVLTKSVTIEVLSPICIVHSRSCKLARRGRPSRRA
jgi:hypothetical protein